MNVEKLFPGRPTIYAYAETRSELAGLLKVGYTNRPVEERMAEHYPTKLPDGTLPYRVELIESAMRADGSCFMDHDVHRVLKARGVLCEGGEWYRCTADDVRAAVVALRSGCAIAAERNLDFAMRPEQERAVEKTFAFYRRAEKRDPDRHPRFLWNAKMRFGKTFAAYELAKKLGAKRVLILTFKPAVESAWREDLIGHVDFAGWQFVSNKNAANENVSIDAQYDAADKRKPIVCFGSFQDLLGKNDAGGIKAKNEFIHLEDWDLVIFDEYHFGAWRDTAAKLFRKDRFDEEQQVDFDDEAYQKNEAGDALDETYIEIDAKYYLYLSGTPFRAFTVHPCFAWAILAGVKTMEWRTFLPRPSEGTCAITVSKSYSPSQWKNEAKWVRKEFGVKLIPFEELRDEWCGKVVAVCDYAASEEDLDGIEYGWRLTNVRPLKNRIPCKGNLKLWTMDFGLSKRVLTEI